jgi:hypothetical protein
MARCPFAQWRPISGSCGSFVGGPFRIIHHTTEGSSAVAAFQAFQVHRSDPHFTVDDQHIYQHIDTTGAARALRNAQGGVETNRFSAIQIEVVGFAGRLKSRPTLENVAQLCRWIEQAHGIPQTWPAGFPRTAVNGQDPGGHNRNPVTWATHGGHYGHSQVPENTHWDPGYTQQEATFVLAFNPNAAGLADPAMEALRESFPEKADLHDDGHIAIPDHSDVEGSDAACPPVKEVVPE